MLLVLSLCFFCFILSLPSLPLSLFIQPYSSYPIHLYSSPSRAIHTTAYLPLSHFSPIQPNLPPNPRLNPLVYPISTRHSLDFPTDPSSVSNVHPPNRHHAHLTSQASQSKTPNPPLRRMHQPRHQDQLRLNLAANYLPYASKPQLAATNASSKWIETRVVVAGGGNFRRLHIREGGAGEGEGQGEGERVENGGGKVRRNSNSISTSRTGTSITHSTTSCNPLDALSSPLARPTATTMHP